MLLPLKFRWIPFSGFRGEVEKITQPNRGRAVILFFRSAEKHKLDRGRWVVASCQIALHSIKRFQRRSRKYEKLTTTDGRTTDDGKRLITIVHLSLRLRCTKTLIQLSKLHNAFYFAAFKIIFLSFYAPITSDECYAWFHLNAASPAARYTEQDNVTKKYCPR